MTNNIFDISGKKALVTGSSNGLGRAIAEGLADNGADVAIHYYAGYDQDRAAGNSADEAVECIKSKGRKAISIEGNLAESGAAGRIFSDAVARLGEIDILVLNASVQADKTLFEMTEEDLNREIQVNFNSTVSFLQNALPQMAANKWGRVLTIGSIQQARPLSQCITYAGLKNAQETLIRSLAVDFARHGVLLNNLAPGIISTQRNHFQKLKNENWENDLKARNPAHMVSSPDDYVGAALLFCSDAGRFITGSNLFATGGGHLPYTEVASGMDASLSSASARTRKNM